MLDFFKDFRETRMINRNSREIVHYLSCELGERTLMRYDNLRRAEDFIFDYFSRFGNSPYIEDYTVEGRRVTNIIAEIEGSDKRENIILIGAHYDTVEGTPGADDNASGIAGLLELYRLLSRDRYRRTLRFAAFTLEEPPYFSSEQMGSMYHVRRCRERRDLIDFMICLEMIGYASNKYDQNFPYHEMIKKYPKKGNYLMVVSLPSSSELTYLWRDIYNRNARREIYEFIGPASITGINLSDNYSFVQNGYPAIMLTDTAFWRNRNYHTAQDRFETINFKFLAYNIIHICETVAKIANLEEIHGGKG
jgi:Zn-dependent M28 family amino/carboxypeptidase